MSRSREGAWIEIAPYFSTRAFVCCRSREGAWIEMIPVILCQSL